MQASQRSSYTNLIKQKSIELGFSFCGISKAVFLAEEAPRLEAWLLAGMHGEMKYMENHFDKRLDPTLLVPGAKSVVSLLFNYYSPQKQADETAPKISMYAYGKDYHKVIKDKLFELVTYINNAVGEVHGRAFVDSAPVLDRAWAKKSGLGWIGKNANLISKQNGSYFFISELIIDLELEYDTPVADHCGTCTACIDACPTQAIVKPQVVDGSRCISYLTIELRNEIPSEFKNKMDNWAFGCDVCQQVCPWNRFARPHTENQFLPDAEMMQMKQNEWFELTEETFNRLFKHSALLRAGYTGMKKNIKFLK
ncbi:MAG: tRNA epoxyqueuosine(34) reductase QueG [Bacteroidia bacterium]|nr:tRNA epoxyqueuosine(34) reductase QueG [Bacteroidia bacterium]